MTDAESWFRWTPDEIKRCRKLAGVSQSELALQLGVTRQAVNYWESGHSNPTTEHIARLHQLLMPVLEGERLVEAANEDAHKWVVVDDAGT